MRLNRGRYVQFGRSPKLEVDEYMATDGDPPYNPDIEIGVNSHLDAEELYNVFCIELDPVRDRLFLRRLGELELGRWTLLETLCSGLEILPENAREIIEHFPGRFSLCHIPWLGKGVDTDQPDSVILAGDKVSMYHYAMLMNVVK